MKTSSLDRVRGLLTLMSGQPVPDSPEAARAARAAKINRKKVPAANKLMSSIRWKSLQPTSDTDPPPVQQLNERPVCLYHTSCQNHNMSVDYQLSYHHHRAVTRRRREQIPRAAAGKHGLKNRSEGEMEQRRIRITEGKEGVEKFVMWCKTVRLF